MKSRLAVACAGSLLLTSAALAQLENENLLVTLPTGYKVDFQQKKDNILISEMVPQKESVKDWTEMVTVQIFFGMKRPPEQFRAQMEKLWSDSCAGSQTNGIAQGPENGYRAVVWMQSCPLNKQSGKPEITWFKAVQGNDSFYLVQKAFKFMPSKDQVLEWTKYLQSVAVCDTRLPDRACPKTK